MNTILISKDSSKKITLLQMFSGILVLYIHCNGAKSFGLDDTSIISNICNYFTRGTSFCCVSVFALISGFLFYYSLMQNDFSIDFYKGKLKSRVKSLLVPYIFWNIVGMLYIIFLTYTPIRQYIGGTDLFEYSLKNILEGVFLYKYNGYLWYLAYLMRYVIFSPIIYFLLKNKYLAPIYLAICFFAGVFNFDFLPEFLQETGFNTLFFFSLGAYFAINKPNVVNMRVSKNSSIISGVLYLVICYINLVVSNNTIAMVLRVLAVICLWFVFDAFVGVEIKDIMKLSFFVYLTHGYILTAFSKVFCFVYLKTGLNSSLGALINTFVIPIVVYFILCMIGLTIKKYTPKLWNIISGGRG